MLIEQIIEFELRGPRPANRRPTSGLPYLFTGMGYIYGRKVIAGHIYGRKVTAGHMHFYQD